VWIAFAVSFLIGSLPAAWIVVRLWAKQDVSAEGSGNVGALNALRVTKSVWVGVVVILLDGAKGALAVWLVSRLGLEAEDLHLCCVATVGVVAGHNYNPWLSIARRKLAGGKGFAAAGGAMLVFRAPLVVGWLAVCVVAWFAFRAAFGVKDEAPATAAATGALVPLAILYYDLPTLWMALGLLAVVGPKLLREVWTELVRRPERSELQP
jgi:glycerol-3-phosphate acyltransferase PlsY